MTSEQKICGSKSDEAPLLSIRTIQFFDARKSFECPCPNNCDRFVYANTTSMSMNSFPAGKDVIIFGRHHICSNVEPKELGQQSPTVKAPHMKEEGISS
eukprot:scaffold3639_cov87-Skeletonema_dohrnii-CCMP3373.AAC.2